MASLFNTRISDTYPGLIKTIDNAAITATLKEITDGNGTGTGLFINTAGDFKVNSILEFGSLKDTAENIIITKFVDAADGISNNDNDTTIPTTAAIVDYVAAQITIEDLDFIGDSGTGQIDLDSQIFDIGGTSNEITTIASGQSLTISLDSTGVNLPDNSTAITQTAGDNSTKIATTSYVDTLDAASDLDITDGTNTGDINLNTQSLSILGTTNEIDTVVSGQGVTIGLPSTINTNLVGNVTGNVTGNLIGDVTGDVTGDLTGNVTSTSVLADGVTATTQSSSDDSTKVATTAYVKGLNNASDLDFKGDNGTAGDVNLNTQRFDILGTTNQITTVSSGQSLTIGLPTNVTVSGIVNATTFNGNLTGNVTGDLTGNSAGTHTGGVIGNVTGNVTGDLTGNADTATAWETARDLSLTGQATGTISSVDGTNNVSGAVTLDNNSVTAKVLTGLTSPSASSVLASDTILQGIGKLQSQVNGLAGGLRFMGSWDADTNSPVLSSGGGEAANGTTTSTTANKLVDSSASFTSTVTVGDQVVNQVDGQTALVSNVDSDTTLSLDADIMLTGEAYTIDNSPFITQGHYYVVSVGGTTTLNGISNWTVGDWVIAGANNQWTKLDHSQVDGTGTTGNLTKWSSTSVIADSIVSESGSAITVDGSLTTNTNLSSTGSFAVNTDKFTVAAASGNTAFTGDLAINTNKFTVNATSGNVAVAGDLTADAFYLNGMTAGSGALYWTSDRVTLANYNASGTLNFETGGGTSALTIDSSQNSTFAGNVFLPDNKYATFGGANNAWELQIGVVGDNAFIEKTATTNGDLYIKNNGSGKGIIFQNGGATALTIDSSQNSTFAGNVSLTSGALSITSDGSNAVTFTESSNGLLTIAAPDDIILDCGSDIVLDANGADIRFKDNGLEFGRISKGGGSDLVIQSSIADKDIFFSGTDGTTGITALLLDMSNGGSATFNDDIDFGGKLTQTGTGDNTFAGDVLIGAGTASNKLTVKASNTGTQITTIPVGKFINTGNSFSKLIVGSDNANFDGVFSMDNNSTLADTKLRIYIGNGSNATTGHSNDHIVLQGNGNVGIGTDDPQAILNTFSSNSRGLAISNGYPFVALNDVDGGNLFLGTQSNEAYLWNSGTNNLIFGNNGAERMRIDSFGQTKFLNRVEIQAADTETNPSSGTNARLIIDNNSNTNGCIAVMDFRNYSSFITARIGAQFQDADDKNTDLYFMTRSNGGTLDERMRISSEGDIGFNTTFADPDADCLFIEAQDNYALYSGSDGTGGSNHIVFGNANSWIGTITTNGSTTTYNTTSDYRLKEDLQDFAGLDMVSKIPVYDFKWKTDESRSYGVMAHELKEVLPDAVVGEKDAEEMQSVDYSKIVPLLVKSIQELKAKVDKLEQECKCKN